jgi:hypothetical protein
MREIGKGNDAHAPDTQGFKQHGLRIAQMLQRVDLQHHVKALVIKHAQALIEVELNDVDAALHTRSDIGIVNFYPITGAATLLLQVAEQCTIAATQIQHPTAVRHHLSQRFNHPLVGHAASNALVWMPSKYDFTTLR